MAVRDRSLYGNGSGIMGRFHIEATTVAGQFLIRNADAATAGEVEAPTTTAAAHLMGVAIDAVTYSTTQASFDGFPGYKQAGEEGTVGIIFDPFAVYQMRVAGGATTGTALATTAPANILTNTVADATGLTVTAAEVGTVDMDGGLMIGRTGNNAGQVRRNTTHTNSTSDVVTVPFPRTIAVGDSFIRVPYSKSAIAVQLTSNFVEANGIIAYGTGAGLRVMEVTFDIIEDEVMLHVISGDHYLNPIA